jgi:hypothetical protein
MDYEGCPKLRLDYGRTSPDSRGNDRPDGPQLLVPLEHIGMDQQAMAGWTQLDFDSGFGPK